MRLTVRQLGDGPFPASAAGRVDADVAYPYQTAGIGGRYAAHLVGSGFDYALAVIGHVAERMLIAGGHGHAVAVLVHLVAHGKSFQILSRLYGHVAPAALAVDRQVVAHASGHKQVVATLGHSLDA